MTPHREQRSQELFRRRRFVAPRKRRSLLGRLLKPFVSSVVIVLLPAALAWWVLASPQLRVGEVIVVATGRVGAAWAEKRLEPLRGRHVLGVRLDEIEDLLADHPWIDSVEMRKELPGRLEVVIRDRLPVAVSKTASGDFYLDASGRPIAEVDERLQPEALVVVESSLAQQARTASDLESTRRAIELAAEWSRLRPGEMVSRVEILNPRAFRLHSETLPFAVLLGDEPLDLPLSRFDSVAALVSEAGVESVDLRFSRQIVFQTAAEPPTREG